MSKKKIKMGLSKIGYQKLVGATKGKPGIRGKRVLDTGIGVIALEMDYHNPLTLFHAQNGECFYCGVVMNIEQDPTRDHFFPKSISWRNRSLRYNCVLACATCNNAVKQDRLPTRQEFEAFIRLYNADIVASTCNVFDFARPRPNDRGKRRTGSPSA